MFPTRRPSTHPNPALDPRANHLHPLPPLRRRPQVRETARPRRQTPTIPRKHRRAPGPGVHRIPPHKHGPPPQVRALLRRQHLYPQDLVEDVVLRRLAIHHDAAKAGADVVRPQRPTQRGTDRAPVSLIVVDGGRSREPKGKIHNPLRGVVVRRGGQGGDVGRERGVGEEDGEDGVGPRLLIAIVGARGGDVEVFEA
ncbi:uncharacterized protein BDZ99DRAFT_74299 [Mytilinidion resinicola]|uniref:Uncharacterized protein n=1 Tax=Mytilinidion resinicola TaxID=574789 RepID=A0A6A6YE63_9PEZI|nr:uncharacterized protein BDZ99DRAFT_74299 [Mytilinidion resinicola]KAF2807106.1 hypothetical protein BDZ99DRAFT_74299 [Mytilinidion resinicola]